MNEEMNSSRDRREEGAGRVPPCDLQAEQAVLGAALLSDTALAKILDFVREKSFYWDKHRKIFTAIVNLSNRNEPHDIVTVAQELRTMESLEEVGGEYYLMELSESVPFPMNADYYARIAERKYLLRQLIEVGTGIGEKSFDPSTEPESLLDGAIQELFTLQRSHERGGYRDLNAVANSTMEEIERIAERKDELTGITSGYPQLDEQTGGFQRGDLIILAARPSMGKTALALSFAHNAARMKRTPVGIISLEMNARSIMMRLLSFETRLSLKKIRHARFSEDEMHQVVDASGKLSQLPIFIDDTSVQTVTDIRARARRLQLQHKVEMIIVDYLTLIQPPDRVESQQQFVASVSRQLKGLAKEMDIPIIVISQLSRAVETRGGSKRPILSDLRDSGAIEQDADVVMFVYRKGYYDQLEGKDREPDYEEDNTAEVIIAKQRNGPTGSVKLAFIKHNALFANLEQTREAAPKEAARETPF